MMISPSFPWPHARPPTAAHSWSRLRLPGADDDDAAEADCDDASPCSYCPAARSPAAS